MKFFDYCATQYASINQEMQVDSLNDAFDLKKQAATKATHELIETTRKWFKFWAKVYFVFDFFKCHFTHNWPAMPVKPAPPQIVPDIQNGQEARN